MKAMAATSRQEEAWQEEHEHPPEQDERSEDGLAVSEAGYWEKYYSHPDFSYEWNNGYLEEKPVSDVKGSRVYQWFCEILRCFFSSHPVGEVINLDIGFRLALPGSTSIRKPDIAVVLDSNAVAVGPDDATYSGTYDICVECLSHSSPKEILRDTSQKRKEYEGIGVGEYYILDARGEETAFLRRNRAGSYTDIVPVGDVIRSALMPEFRFRVSDLYRQPSLREMAEDDIYKGYVLPFHQKVKARAEWERRRNSVLDSELTFERERGKVLDLELVSERKKADGERQNAEREKQRSKVLDLELASERTRAEAERQKAERLAAKLRELGISPEDI